MKRLATFSFLLAMAANLLAQSPQSFNYQAVVRDASGQARSDSELDLEVAIRQGSAAGTVVYSESFTKTTNAFGLVTVAIGNGSVIFGNFADIDWGSDEFFLETTVDGTSMGVTQLLSVPYAFHASFSDSVRTESQELYLSGSTLSISQGNSIQLPAGGTSEGTGKEIVVITGDVSDAEAATIITNELGTLTRSIWIYGTTDLTSLEIASIKNLFEVKVENNLNFAALLLPDLETVGELILENNPALSSLDLNSLKVCKGINLVFTKINILSMPAVEYFLQNINLFDNPELTGLDVPNLKSFRGMEIHRNPKLLSINLPGLISLQNIGGEDNSSLTSITLGNVKGPFSVNLRKNPLPSEVVNHILAVILAATPGPLVNPPYNDKYINLQNIPPAPPTGQGLIDEQALIALGYILQTD